MDKRSKNEQIRLWIDFDSLLGRFWFAFLHVFSARVKILQSVKKANVLNKQN